MTMKRGIRISLWVGIAALSLGTWAIAEPSVTLTVPGNINDNIYTVDGVTNTSVISDPLGVPSYLTNFSGNSFNNVGAADGSAYENVTGEYNLQISSPNTVISGLLCQLGLEKCVAPVAVSVPEGGAAFAYLLLAGLCCFGAIRMRSHRQIGGISAA
jgi:hypothetical protein